jgi:hypothetical protein
VIQLVSIVGALMILAAYAANQFGWLRASALSYSVVNAVGAGILTVVAALESQWGFLLLEAAWTVVSVAALVAMLRPRTTRMRRAVP